MWDMFKQAAGGFLSGTLFTHPGVAYGMLALGIAITAAMFLAFSKLGLPLVAAAAIAGFLGGALQPRLFKNVKFR